MFETTADRNKLLLHYPASWWRNRWREALPTGNGKIGAAVYGSIGKETLLINHTELWHLGIKNELPDVSHSLKETRTLMNQRKYHQANWHLANTLNDAQYSSKLAKPLPLTNFHVDIPTKTGFSNYCRGLNMETGEVCVKWKSNGKEFTRNVFTSHARDMIICRCSAGEDGFQQASFSFSLPITEMAAFKDKMTQRERTVICKGEGSILFFKASNEDGTDYGAVAKVFPSNGERMYKDGKLICNNFKDLLIVIKVFIQSNAETEWIRLKEELNCIDGDYHALLHEHLAVYQPLFFSSRIQLTEDKKEMFNEELILNAYQKKTDTRLFEKLWSYGRYLFLTGTSIHGQPFSMYGLWHGDYDLMWSHRMANENIQMMYWHVGVGGLSEYTNALIDYYMSMIDDFRDNARKLYGCNGIYIPAGTTPGQGKPNQIVPVILNWTSAAGWLAQHFYDYYLFTGKEQVLRKNVLPFMKEVADFYLDFVEQTDDEIRYYPSVSPENTPLNFMPKTGDSLAHPMPTTINATMDIAIIKELLNNLIEASDIIGLYKEDRWQWKELLKRIPNYPISKTGGIKEWIGEQFDDNPQHRHLSHLYPIFPGKEAVKNKRAFLKAVESRDIQSQTGWSYAHLANVYARLLDGNKALSSLEQLIQSCLLNNFYTVHNDWRDMGLTMDISAAPVQLDANLGIVNAIQEMLFYVSSTEISFLPALPDKWNKGTVEQFRFYTGKVSFHWNRKEQYFQCVVKAERETALYVQFPNFIDQLYRNGTSEHLNKKKKFHITMQPGEVLNLSSEKEDNLYGV